MFAIRSFISIIDDHSLTPCSPVVAYRFTYHAQPVVVDNSRNYRRFGAGHQQRLEKSNRTCGGLPGQAPCGTMQAHRVCKRPVPKPRGFPSRAGLRLDSIASVESRGKACGGPPSGASVPETKQGSRRGNPREPDHLQCKVYLCKFAVRSLGQRNSNICQLQCKATQVPATRYSTTFGKLCQERKS